MKTSDPAMRACSTTAGASALTKSSPHWRMLPMWPTPCWKHWPITITGNPKSGITRSTNGSKITPNHQWSTSLHLHQWTEMNPWIWKAKKVLPQPHHHLALLQWRHHHLVLPHWCQPRRRYQSRKTTAARPQSSSKHPPTSTGMRMEKI